MKAPKQRFTQWYNKLHKRSGALWEGRFRNVQVESVVTPLATMATYFDLHPVRAELVDGPEDYRSCGYDAALGGDELGRH